MTQPTDDRSITRLIKALPNHTAIMELGEIGAPAAKAVPYLIRLLERENSHLDESIVETLGKIGDPRAVPILVKTVLENQQKFMRAFLESSTTYSVGMLTQTLIWLKKKLKSL